MRVSRLWHFFRSATWEEWTAGLWVGVAPSFLHWYSLWTAPLVLVLVLRGSGRRLRRQDAQSRHDADAYTPHRAVNLLPEEYCDTGGLRTDGSWVLSASTGTKEHGTRTPATRISAGFSSFSGRGEVWVDVHAPTWPRRASSFTAPSSLGGATADRGASGVPLASAD